MSKMVKRKIGNNSYSIKHYCDCCGEYIYREKIEVIPQAMINWNKVVERINEQNHHRIRRGFNVVGYVCDKCFEQYMKDNPRCTSDARDDYFKKGE